MVAASQIPIGPRFAHASTPAPRGAPRTKRADRENIMPGREPHLFHTNPGKAPSSSDDLPRGSDDLVPAVFEGAPHPLQGLPHFREDDPYLIRTAQHDLGKLLQILTGQHVRRELAATLVI